MIGFDYTSRIAPSALKAAGCSVASRYVMPQTPFWVKALRNAEAAELRAAGIPILCNFESTADRMSGGAAAGTADALQVLQSLDALGAPAGVTVWFSADWNVQPGDVPAVLAYLQAAAKVLKPKDFGTALYGGLRAVSAAADAGYPIWQTVAWSGGKWDSRAAMRQTGTEQTVGGVQVDVNEVMNLAALGAWGGPTTGADVQLTDQITIPPYAIQYFSDYGFNSPTISVADLLAWTAARASHTVNQMPTIENKLDQLLARPAAPTADEIGTAVAAHLSSGGGASAADIAAAVGHLFAQKLGA